MFNADDINCLKMADHTDAERIAYFTMNPKNDLVRRHIQAGGLAAVLEEGINGHMITLYDDRSHMPLLWTHLIPATLEGKACTTCRTPWHLRLSHMRKALNWRIFDKATDFRYILFSGAGRLNIFNELPFKVILDYAHNPVAVRCMVDLVTRLDASGRKICVLAAPGDRRDEDVLEIAQIAAAGPFDHILVRQDDSLRGREQEEVPRLLRKGLIDAGFDAEKISLSIDEREAVDTALKMCQRGDLLLVLVIIFPGVGNKLCHSKRLPKPKSGRLNPLKLV